VSENPPRASVVIVVKRAGPKLHRCLDRLAAMRCKNTFETLIVLNGRPAQAADQLELEGVRVVAYPVHLGLAGALNRVRPDARGEFIVSLHDDTEPADGWLDALIVAADENGAGAVGSLVLNPDGSVQAAGWELHRDGVTTPPWSGDPPPPSAFASPRPVDYCPSCSLLVRASSFDRAGGADERFFPVVYVDVDLCLALRARGQQVLVAPSSVVMHHKGSSAAPDYFQFVWQRNRERLLDKWAAFLPEQVPGSGRTWSLPEDSIPSQDRQPDESARERAQLIRGVETAEAFASHLRAEFATATEERERLRAHLGSADAELTRVHAELACTHAELARMHAELVRTGEQLTAVDAELREHAEALAQIRAGGWWRLRSRLLPLLRLAAATRRRLRPPPRA
jgi:GT2 family glycosyltransferase